ncbi:MAG: hypothetical protein P9X27_02060 [Candidatus Kaelpia aquatica]|nr:hypothetical protein [Candidatus Kaelpia aquatica]
MNKKLNLKCFVATSFERSDVDQIYKSIKTSLKKKNIYCCRIDKIEHNKEIPSKIREEIVEADFVIADLTYARPSVYYEAGFAERSIPVVYTSRKDHFKPKIDDVNGNYSIHFDLYGKNIISWKNSKDKDFIKKLEKRVNHVIAPIIRRKEKMYSEIQNSDLYGKLSCVDKKLICVKGLDKYFKKNKFRKQSSKAAIDNNGVLRYDLEGRLLLKDKAVIDVLSMVRWKPTLYDLRTIGFVKNSHSRDRIKYEYYLNFFNYSKIENIHKSVLLVSPNKINFKRFSEIVGSYRNESYKNIKYLTKPFCCMIIKVGKVNYKVNLISKLIVVDNIKSQIDLDSKLKNVFELFLEW